MNTPIDPQAQENLPKVNEQRRRLAKAGLAAPVVMGTLLSRPVLGATPHNCTISGKLSGNTSTHGDPVDCKTLGRSPGYWKQSQWSGEWMAPYVYGPETGNKSITSATGTPFNEASALGSTFKDVFHVVAITETKTETTTTNGACIRWKNGKCKAFEKITETTESTVQTGSEVVDPSDKRFASGVPATLLQVLETGGGLNDTEIAALGRAAVASLLNAAKFGTQYPLTGKQVIDMFNTVRSGGVYPINDSVSWNADQVKTYFESLYGNL